MRQSAGGSAQQCAFDYLRVQRASGLKAWFNSYLGRPPDQRAEAVAPVRSRIGAYAKSQYASVVLGQRESTIVLSDVLTNGLVLLVSTTAGTIGKAVASILGVRW